MRTVLPANFTGRGIIDALTAQATDRHTAMLRRSRARSPTTTRESTPTSRATPGHDPARCR